MLLFFSRCFLACFVFYMSSSLAWAVAFPPPEPIQDPELSAFIMQLKEAVERKDKEFILSIVHPKCHVTYGGFAGLQDFKEYWFGVSAHGENFFIVLERALRLGGAMLHDGEEFILPYTALAPPLDEHGVMLAVITASPAFVRAWPGLDAQIIQELSYEQVTLCNIEVPVFVDGIQWHCILLADETRGYIASTVLALPGDHCFRFRCIDGKWMLVSTIAVE